MSVLTSIGHGQVLFLIIEFFLFIIFTDYVKQLGTILADASAPNPGHSLSEIEGWETLVKTSGNQTIAGVKNFSGNVGIGTATPGAKLTIADNGSPAGARLLDIGDDTYLTDIDSANTLGIYGI